MHARGEKRGRGRGKGRKRRRRRGRGRRSVMSRDGDGVEEEIMTDVEQSAQHMVVGEMYFF